MPQPAANAGVRRVKLTEDSKANRRRSGGMHVNRKVKSSKLSDWQSINWQAIPEDLAKLEAIRRAGDEEIARVQGEANRWRDAYRELFKKTHGGVEPVEQEKAPSRVTLGDWLVTLDIKQVVRVQRAIRRWRLLNKLRSICTRLSPCRKFHSEILVLS